MRALRRFRASLMLETNGEVNTPFLTKYLACRIVSPQLPKHLRATNHARMQASAGTMSIHHDCTVVSLPLSTRLSPGPAVFTLLIHGLGDGGFVWDAFLPYLARSSSAVTIDLRGHGDSPWDPRQSYRIEAHVADLVALIDKLEQKRIVLVGHSLGAQIAIRSAAERRHRVSGLVIVDGGPELNERAARALAQHLKTLRWRYTTISQLTDLLTERHPLARRAVLENYARSALRRTADGEFELKADPALPASLSPPDDARMWEALDSLSCPKLLVRGVASSMLTQRSAERTSLRLRNCRLVTVPRAGHSIPLDNPAGLYDAISPFLAEIAP